MVSCTESSIYTSSLIKNLRNQAAQVAIESDIDYLLMVDDDMTFSVRDCELLVGTLVDNPEYSSVGGYALSSAGTEVPNVNWLVKSEVLDKDGNKEPDKWIDPKERKKRAKKNHKAGIVDYNVDQMGTGFLLIRVDDLKKMPWPWFDDPFTPLGFIGEDTYFTLKQKQHDLTPVCHFGIKVGHVGKVVY